MPPSTQAAAQLRALSTKDFLKGLTDDSCLVFQDPFNKNAFDDSPSGINSFCSLCQVSIAPGLDPVQKTAGEMHVMMHLTSSLLHGT